MASSLKTGKLIAVLLAVIALSASFFAGFICYKNKVFPYSLLMRVFETPKKKNYKPYIPPREKINDEYGLGGWWQKADTSPGEESGTSKKEREALDNLKSIGYLSGYKKADSRINVTVYDKKEAFDGVNLYNSGHSPEAFMIDMDGNVIHRWHYDFDKAFPGATYTKLEVQSKSDLDYWRRIHLFENGDLLAIYEGYGIIRIDKNSKLLWKLNCGAHHDLDIDEKGNIYLLGRKEKNIERINRTRNVLDEYIIILNPDGKEIKRISILEAFENSSFSPFLNSLPLFGDLFHTNSIQYINTGIERENSVFHNGNVLISMRNTDIIAVIDIKAEKVVWALTGQWHRQHEATLLDNGNILLFDNMSKKDFSQIIEFDPFSLQIKWSYGEDIGQPFYSEYCGTNQRLLNGNTLITESNSGRAFEITSSGEIVWEFYNPNRAGKNKELIATLFEVVRLPKKYAQTLTQDK